MTIVIDDDDVRRYDDPIPNMDTTFRNQRCPPIDGAVPTNCNPLPAVGDDGDISLGYLRRFRDMRSKMRIFAYFDRGIRTSY